eukprot:12879900-Prorocentrum_lima.AAC.1
MTASRHASQRTTQNNSDLSATDTHTTQTAQQDTVANNNILRNPWHTFLPQLQQDTDNQTTWIYIYNRHTYLHHAITAQPQNMLEYHLRAHIRYWDTRVNALLPINPTQLTSQLTDLLGQTNQIHIMLHLGSTHLHGIDTYLNTFA